MLCNPTAIRSFVRAGDVWTFRAWRRRLLYRIPADDDLEGLGARRPLESVVSLQDAVEFARLHGFEQHGHGDRYRPAGCLYERARRAMPGQGTIDRITLTSTRTPKAVVTNTVSSIRHAGRLRASPKSGTVPTTPARSPPIPLLPAFRLGSSPSACYAARPVRPRSFRACLWHVDRRLNSRGLWGEAAAR